MRECMFCGSKTIAFYVSSEDKYICPKHYLTAKQELGEDSVKHFYKNKIVIDNNIAYMTIYNNKYTEKEIVMIDVEDIELIKDMRWHIANSNHVITYVAPPKMKVSKRTGLTLKSTLRLSDYLLYKREGVTSPTYHTNGNLLDCRKHNIRKCKDKLREKSTVKNIKNVVL